MRVNPFQTNGPTNTVGAKFDFQVKDPTGAAEMHWLPSMTYQDPRRMSLPRPVGSQYQGMLVYPLMMPEAFLTQFAFPRNRPQTSNVKVQERRELPDLEGRYQRAAPSMPGLGAYGYGAVALTVSYDQ
ncbi:MAG: hypothetical protein Q8N47_07430, partial [Bryobacterales bacterium]|nr:hypothetical protein [Bryobacterales bacterium]